MSQGKLKLLEDGGQCECNSMASGAMANPISLEEETEAWLWQERGGPEPFPVAPGAPSSEQEKNPGGLPRPVYVGSQCL